MYSLLNFLKKYNNILLFLILEVLCIIMLVNNLPYQKRKLTKVGNAISGRFFKTKTNCTDYFSLKEENQLMVEHNALLMSQLYNSDNDDSVLIDSSSFEFRFIPAKVINNSVYNVNNYLLIDKGRRDGIEKDMGVICEKGVVGKVVNVTDNYASVISMLHPYTVVSARFTDNQHIANVTWGNRDYRFGTVNDIPLHLNLEKGDTLVTSGFSNIYPADIMVGTIEEMLESDSKDFNSAKIRFSTNFSTLRHVFVIENLHQAEIDSLTLNQ
ncbi:MAG: rod shape-determining protein MreC [Bacteroidales bacterium]|nr:rod shape-determining protein MreC [Bacteroidales bacterium]